MTERMSLILDATSGLFLITVVIVIVPNDLTTLGPVDGLMALIVVVVALPSLASAAAAVSSLRAPSSAHVRAALAVAEDLSMSLAWHRTARLLETPLTEVVPGDFEGRVEYWCRTGRGEPLSEALTMIRDRIQDGSRPLETDTEEWQRIARVVANLDYLSALVQ